MTTKGDDAMNVTEAPRMDVIERLFFVPGVPVPKGSGEGTAKQRGNRKRGAWRENLEIAMMRVRPSSPWPGPVGVSIAFYLEGDLMRQSVGDVDKLARFVIDELTGEFFVDDRQVVSAPPLKVGAERSAHGPGAAIRVRPLPDDRAAHGDAFEWLEAPIPNAAPELA